MKKNKQSPTGGQTSEASQDSLALNTSTNNIDEAANNVKAENKDTTKKDAKSREWWCVVYPDSAPENWRDLVQQTFLEAYISPLHDKDVNPDGAPKKPHYHVVLAWPGPTTYSNAKNIMAQFGGVIQPKVIGSLRGVCRYLCHLDNPEKAQYSPDDVICYNGADWLTVINLQTDKYNSIEEMQDFCSKYRITSFVDLNTYARKKRKADWFRSLCDGAGYIMREYCKSLQYCLDNNFGVRTIDDIEAHIAKVDLAMEVDPNTGEVKGGLEYGKMDV